MPYSFAVPMPDKSIYNVKQLLAAGKSNTKTMKSDNAGSGYLTSSLSLAPAKASGFNLCPAASAGCIRDCLYTSGLAGVFPRTIRPARIAKSRMLRLYPKEFFDRLNLELDRANKKAKRNGAKLCVRLNVYSDVKFEEEFPAIFDRFSDIQFYDYTKIVDRMSRYLDGGLPPNYHLTFSRSEKNWDDCVRFLVRGANIAVPFHVRRSQPLPTSYLGFPVVDGDLTDLRFLDPQGGYIVGLRPKGKGRKDKTSGFIVSIGEANAERQVA